MNAEIGDVFTHAYLLLFLLKFAKLYMHKAKISVIIMYLCDFPYDSFITIDLSTCDIF